MATTQQDAEAVAASINQGTVARPLRVRVFLSLCVCGWLILSLYHFVWGIFLFSEQLFHELEQKYIDVKSELAVVDAEKQEAVREKHAACT